jgi:hypothetical protein
VIQKACSHQQSYHMALMRLTSNLAETLAAPVANPEARASATARMAPGSTDVNGFMRLDDKNPRMKP